MANMRLCVQVTYRLYSGIMDLFRLRDVISAEYTVGMVLGAACR